MRKRAPIDYIFLLIIIVEFIAVLIVFCSANSSMIAFRAIHKLIIAFLAFDVSLFFIVELIRDYLLHGSLCLVSFFKSRIIYYNQIYAIGMAKLKQRYKGSALGWSWAILRPAITIFIFWFAIELGLRHGGDIHGYPYFLWLIAGFIPWFYMKDMLTYGAACMRNNYYFLRVGKFPIIIIPAITSISLLPVHIVLLGIEIAVFWLFGYPPTIYLLQLPIYMFIMFFFFDFWGLYAGVMSAISKDFLNLVNALISAIFWLSGIIYEVGDMRNEWIKFILGLNPITIIVTG